MQYVIEHASSHILSGVTNIAKQLGGYSTKSHVKLEDFVYNREINTGIVPLCLGITK